VVGGWFVMRGGGGFSKEQSGPKYDPVEAQLSHLPEGLRKRCAVVDTTRLSKDEVPPCVGGGVGWVGGGYCVCRREGSVCDYLPVDAGRPGATRVMLVLPLLVCE
jgi:hypothetical protein